MIDGNSTRVLLCAQRERHGGLIYGSAVTSQPLLVDALCGMGQTAPDPLQVPAPSFLALDERDRWEYAMEQMQPATLETPRLLGNTRCELVLREQS